jgi:uncharacterized membrane protein YkvA (DUF1232 family)
MPICYPPTLRGDSMAGQIITANWKQRAKQLKREIHAVYLAIKDPRTPWYARVLATVIVGYAFSPIDLIPDPIPVLGYLDDLILLPLGILLLVKLLPEEVMADCRATAAASAGGKKPTNWFAGAIIGAIWLGAIYLTVRLLWGFFQPTEP